ncbi:hypothetical protein [Staphylococcus canis]|uniref:Uncharacterized protein n=1 Tax=Staphylococcus canis TaxID=2724942 RepID=A0ABS0TBQ0_9STAP|nr:hypothetical protein [Staphylococcus canis]MBI5975832.1 hypothetical protein [Staphylococcus canis]
MNQHNIPTCTQALHNLNQLLEYATFFNLHYRVDKDLSDAYLKKLEQLVTQLFNVLPHPDHLSFTPLYPYDAYYYCLDNLSQSPLIRIDFGNQIAVNQGYIDVILYARSQLLRF